MRPTGTFGEVVVALQAAAQQGPGTVRELCERAQVGFDVGRYTATRMVQRGELVPVQPGRPMVLAVSAKVADVAAPFAMPTPTDLSLEALATITSGWVSLPSY